MQILNEFTSFKGVIIISFLSLLVFLGRTFIDFYYVYGEFSLNVGVVGLVMLVNMALFGGWIWGLMSAWQNGRRGIVVLLGFDLFFLLVIAVGTLAAYCPSPCRTAWPLAEIANWTSLIVGLLAAIALGLQMRRGIHPAGAIHPQTAHANPARGEHNEQ